MAKEEYAKWSPNSQYYRTGNTFNVPVADSVKIEELPDRYWIPGRSRARTPDPRFVRDLESISDRLAVGYNPVEYCFEIWVKDPSVRTEYCRGWRRLFKVCKDGEPIQLDGRALAMVYAKDAQSFGGAKRWYQRIVEEVEREKATRKKDSLDKTRQTARDYWNHTKIRVGYGQSSGSKFTDHHAE